MPERVTNWREALEPVRRYYAKPENAAGGSLHIVLDDGNLGDSHVKFCREFAERKGDVEGVVLADLLARMSMTQRRKLYGSYGKYMHILPWETRRLDA